MADFKTILIKKRKELGLSQKEMAEYLHVTRQAISKWENGRGLPDMASVPDIAELLGVSVDELLTGKEPEKQIVERVVEKEVVKPMPTFKILSIVLPIVMVVILASILMGIYIPRAIAKQTPPATVLPEPEPKYTHALCIGKNNSDENTFSAEPINGKAYFDLDISYRSEYTLYITAPKGAVATYINYHLDVEKIGKVIAEFEENKTIEYTQYFDDSGVYHLDGTHDIRHAIIVDLSKCSEEDKTQDVKMVVKQHIGFDGVVIPANERYYVALEVPKKAGAWHYRIKSEGIGFCGLYITESIGENKYTIGDIGHYDYDKWMTGRTDFYLTNMSKQNGDTTCGDWQVEFINRTDKDIELQLEEIPIEEIQLGQEITLNPNDNWVGNITITIFKLHLDAPTKLLTEFRYNGEYSFNSSIYWDDRYWISPQNQYPSYRRGWYVNAMPRYNTEKFEAEVYVLIYIRKDNYDKPKKFVIDDEPHYLLRQAQYELNEQN